MMRPLNLREFADQLRLEGHPFADEILMLIDIDIDIDKEVAEPYSDLCADLEHYAPGKTPDKALEWLGDRSHVLTEIEKQLQDAGRNGEPNDALKEVLGESENIETIMRKYGGWTEGDLQDALFALIERAGKPMEYDL